MQLKCSLIQKCCAVRDEETKSPSQLPVPLHVAQVWISSGSAIVSVDVHLFFSNAPSLSHCSLSLKRKHALQGKLDDKQKRLEANQQVQQMCFYTRKCVSTTCRCLHVSKNFNPNLPTKGNDAGANGSPGVFPTVRRHGPSALGAEPCVFSAGNLPVSWITSWCQMMPTTWWHGSKAET